MHVTNSNDAINGLLTLWAHARDCCWLLLVALLWGATNPFLRRASIGLENVHTKRQWWCAQFCAELAFLASNWKYVLPFLMNQSGSLLFYLTLASVDLSLAVPITNSLTFVFTSLSGKLLGEQFGSAESYIGIACVLGGVTLCVASKATST